MPMMQGAIATTQPGACSSSVAFPSTYKFTGKERDSESGLDNFGARYDASSMGRFMTPDPANIGVDQLNPRGGPAFGFASTTNAVGGPSFALFLRRAGTEMPTAAKLYLSDLRGEVSARPVHSNRTGHHREDEG